MLYQAPEQKLTFVLNLPLQNQLNQQQEYVILLFFHIKILNVGFADDKLQKKLFTQRFGEGYFIQAYLRLYK